MFLLVDFKSATENFIIRFLYLLYEEVLKSLIKTYFFCNTISVFLGFLKKSRKVFAE
jgi:hypothetical protein